MSSGIALFISGTTCRMRTSAATRRRQRGFTKQRMQRCDQDLVAKALAVNEDAVAVEDDRVTVHGQKSVQVPRVVPTLQRGPLPLPEICCGFISSLQEIEQSRVRRRRLTDDLVWQDELLEVRTVERFGWLDRCEGEASGLRVRIGIERGVCNRAAP